MKTLPKSKTAPPPRYVDALRGEDPIASQRGAASRMRKLIQGLTPAQLRKRPAPGKWSIHEILAHLADGEVILGSRMRFVAAMDRPPIVAYDQDLFVKNLATDQVSSAELLAAFEIARMLNIRLLERLPRSAFKRVGLHAERGEESLGMMVAMYAGHDRIHEQQIREVREIVAGKPRAAAKAKPAARSTARAR